MNSICCATYSVYKPTFKLIRHNIRKNPENSSEAETWFWWNSNLMCRRLWALLTPPPLSSVFVHQRAKNCPSMTKVKRGQDTHYLSVYQIWGLYIICKAMNADKWLWPIFGCKVGQSVQIGMKLEPDVWHHPLDVYATFQTDISQHVQQGKSEGFDSCDRPSNLTQTGFKLSIYQSGNA